MIHGMTGFGRGEASAGGMRIVVDVRTVNHRFLDIDLRGTPLPPRAQVAVRRAVEARLARGRVDVQVRVASLDPEAAPLRLDMGLMHAVTRALKELARDSGVAGELSLADLSRLPWARALEAVELELGPEHEEGLARALAQALDRAVDVRRREGEDLARDLRARTARLVELSQEAGRSAAAWPAQQLERLRARMAEILGEHRLDESRLAQEAAMLAERTDASEELTRLASHLASLAELVAGEGAAGKRLDFTLQEAFREVNTLGSKSRDVGVSALVIEMKAELERMREQAANVE